MQRIMIYQTMILIYFNLVYILTYRTAKHEALAFGNIYNFIENMEEL